jgi:hypothetical protein
MERSGDDRRVTVCSLGCLENWDEICLSSDEKREIGTWISTISELQLY